MATREHVVNKIKEMGYHFKRDCWRVGVFKKGTHRLEVPKRDILSDEWVRQRHFKTGQYQRRLTKKKPRASREARAGREATRRGVARGCVVLRGESESGLPLRANA